MRARRTRPKALLRRWALVMLFLFLLPLQLLNAAPNKAAGVAGVWQREGKQDHITINLSGNLTPKQRSLIDSGFSTFTQLTVRGEPRARAEQPPIFQVSCTVKFDAWQERYELAHLNDRPKAVTVKDFASYARLCLSANLDDPALLKQHAAGGQLWATLLLDQISLSKAEEIKEWLVRQQSGVMQGLFSHMLGELKLTEQLDVVVSIPPKNAAAQCDRPRLDVAVESAP